MDEGWANHLDAEKENYDALVEGIVADAQAQHEEDANGMSRFARMLKDYKSARPVIAGRREEEYAVKKETARLMKEAEMVERRGLVLKERQATKNRIAEEERQRTEQQEKDRIQLGECCDSTVAMLAPNFWAAEREGEVRWRRHQELSANVKGNREAQAKQDARGKREKNAPSLRSTFLAGPLLRQGRRSYPALGARGPESLAGTPSSFNTCPTTLEFGLWKPVHPSDKT